MYERSSEETEFVNFFSVIRAFSEEELLRRLCLTQVPIAWVNGPASLNLQEVLLHSMRPQLACCQELGSLGNFHLSQELHINQYREWCHDS